MVNSFVPLESNPDVLTRLAESLGLSDDLSFHDVYSLDDPDLLSFIPRPALALMLVFPVSDAYEEYRREQDKDTPPFETSSDDDVIWLKQTIGNACGTYAVLHSTLNGPAFDHVRPNSVLAQFKADLAPLTTKERVGYIENSNSLEAAHSAVASDGDTTAPDATEEVNLHFVAFVKSKSNVLYELDGRRAGPIRLTKLAPENDVLSPAAVLFVKRFMDREAQAASPSASYLSFSLVALAPSLS
ncbi:hypothetical protein POJ06DRAFT_96296 [Lipomyces tetrasporus]|uniref:Ubiquitin carboxyl-terminal hydrolase n=1 Tax=Lipomyces tetrasporus TaxID=54092 RepID=A0AAD7QTV0_9ASCO|nr:uncharacterized protein POJ06DRAFT_96296 [Lipomyces tetrasporus]KAJ8101404.1 hypothetical protein POJ06DRAFT_96296 [Lipomyces tetrasporus]